VDNILEKRKYMQIMLNLGITVRKKEKKEKQINKELGLIT